MRKYLNASGRGMAINWVLIGVGFGLFYWVLESIRDVLAFEKGPLLERIFYPEPVTVWMRLLVICILLLFAVYAQTLKKKMDHKDESLRKSRTNVVQASILFGFFYWALESLRTMLLSTEGTLLQRLMLPTPMEMWMRLLAVFVLFLFGLYVQSMLTEHEKLEAALKKRSKFERCITNISAHFISLAPQEFQSGIDETLTLISKFAEVDHSFVYIQANMPDMKPRVFENDEGNGLNDLFINNQMDKWEWWNNNLKRFECVEIDSDNPLPPEARSERIAFSEAGIQAILAVPIVYGTELLGFLGSYSSEKVTWKQNVASLLKLVSDVIANALQRRVVETQLRESEERYRQIVENADDIIYRLDREGRFVYVNEVAQKIAGFTQEEFLEKTYLDFVHPDSRAEAGALLEEQLNKRKPSTYLEFQAVTKQDCPLYLDQNMQLIQNNGSICGLQAVARDITQRKEVEGAMQSANEKLSNLERMKSQFLSSVSHELRTPIAIMREGVSLCLDGLAGPLTDQQKDLLTDTSKNIDRLNALIADLLDVSKLETGGEQLQRNTINIYDLIHSVFDTFSGEIQSKQLSLSIEPQNGPVSLYADEEKIRQILTHLVSNAVQFTNEGGSVTARIEDKETEIVISIQDTGVGIARENMNKLFEKFEQFDRMDGPDCKGTGVGLAIAKGLVEHHGGKIWAESEPGRGSEFFFTVPKSPFPKILIVDDMESIIHIIKRFLSVDNYRFVEAMNGEDAIKAARDEAPDLIMLDMKLPKMSGYEVIGRLSQDIRTRDIPVLAMTGYAVDQQQLGQVDEDANIPIIGKPFEQEILRAKVDSLLRQNA